MNDIYMLLVKEAFEKNELYDLLKADSKYIYDENHNYKYATSPEKVNMRADEISRIQGMGTYDVKAKAVLQKYIDLGYRTAHLRLR